jgi:uncharacterized membrane protein YbhN (UPF0104 family)
MKFGLERAADAVDRLSAPGRGWRRPLLTLALVFAAVAGTLVLLSKAAGFAEVGRSLRHAQPQWLALAAACEIVAYLGYGLVLRESFALRRGPRLSPSLTTALVLASLGATRLVAAGGVGLTYWALRRVGCGRRAAGLRLAAFNGAVSSASWRWPPLSPRPERTVRRRVEWRCRGWSAYPRSSPRR